LSKAIYGGLDTQQVSLLARKDCSMEYRFLGKSGLKVSALSLGSWVTFGKQIDEATASDCMQVAYDHGVNFFDNAEAYANGQAETVMGNIFKQKQWNRSSYVVSTKIFWGGEGINERGLSRKHIIEGMNASLKRLQLDYVDLVFCHRQDLHTPIEETVRAMSHLIDKGQAFYWGTSEWSAQEIMEAHLIARREHLIPPTMEQPQYHMFCRDRVEKEYLNLFSEYGVGTTIWSPLASGMLTGKYNDGVPENSRMSLSEMAWLKERLESEDGRSRIAKIRRIAPIASELGCTQAQLALAWCARNPNVSTVITGATRTEHVKENMKALDFLPHLSTDIISAIDAILENKPPGPVDQR